MFTRGFSSWGVGQSLISFVAILLIGLVIAGSTTAFAFTVHLDGTNGTADIPGDDMFAPNRWSYIPGSFVDTFVRGLDGGIEYSIAEDFCRRLIRRFVDQPRPDCAQLRKAVKSAFDRWSEEHPHLRFVDVSHVVRTTIESPAGAEVDLFARHWAEYPKVRSSAAVTSWWTDDENPIGTNGQVLPGKRLLGSDIVFNSGFDVCYYYAIPIPLEDCNHFESLVLHEIGHTLGLFHSYQSKFRNFDTDDNPVNKMEIQCAEPTRALQVSWNIDEYAVMNVGTSEATPIIRRLRNDDIGGRNFLYPICSRSNSAIGWGKSIAEIQSGFEILMFLLLGRLGWIGTKEFRRTRKTNNF